MEAEKKAKPHQRHNEPLKTGQQETSSHNTGKRMGHIDRTGSGETVLFMQTIISA